MSLHSEPNTNLVTPKCFKIIVPASAKVSADSEPNTKGSSQTISTLFSKAILTLSSLVKTLISPRSKK